MTITMPPALDRLVREKVNTGLYANESEVICEALRRGFAHETMLGWVQGQAAEGFEQLDAGKFDDFTREELLAHLAQRHAA